MKSFDTFLLGLFVFHCLPSYIISLLVFISLRSLFLTVFCKNSKNYSRGLEIILIVIFFFVLNDRRPYFV